MIKAILFDLGDTLIHERIDDLENIDKLKLYLKPFAKKVLEELHKNYKIGLITDTETSNEESVSKALNQLGIEDFFSAIVTSVDIGQRKPNSKIFQEALEKLEVTNEEVIMVGNDPNQDIIGAKNLKIRTILYCSSSYYDANSSIIADANINSLSELPQTIKRLDLGQSKPNETSEIVQGYQVAVQMAIYDGQLSWSVTGTYIQFSILLVAGAIFPSFTGSTDKLVLTVVGGLVSLGGLILTSMFGSMVNRIRTYEGYWASCATKLESFLDKKVMTFTGSSELSKKKSVDFDGKTFKLKKISSIKSKLMLNSLYATFILVFVGLIVLNLIRLFDCI